MDPTDEVDVLIVGARVAGSILATLLGQAGHHVVVVDRATFPSATISTHFFRGAWCVSALDAIGVLPEVLATGAPPLVREYNADALDGTWSVDPPQDPGPVGYCLSVRRETLDAILVERARREPTVTVVEGTSMHGLTFDDDRVVGATIATDTDTRLVRARVVVGADGHASRVAREVGAATQELIPASRAMYYRYLHGMDGPHGVPDGPEFSAGDDDLAYVFPSDDGYACVAISSTSLTTRWSARTPRKRSRSGSARTRSSPSGQRRRHPWGACGHAGRGTRSSASRWDRAGRWSATHRCIRTRGRATGWTSLRHRPATSPSRSTTFSPVGTEEAAWRTYHRRRDEHGLPGWRETGELGKDLNTAFRAGA